MFNQVTNEMLGKDTEAVKMDWLSEMCIECDSSINFGLIESNIDMWKMDVVLVTITNDADDVVVGQFTTDNYDEAMLWAYANLEVMTDRDVMSRVRELD